MAPFECREGYRLGDSWEETRKEVRFCVIRLEPTAHQRGYCSGFERAEPTARARSAAVRDLGQVNRAETASGVPEMRTQSKRVLCVWGLALAFAQGHPPILQELLVPDECARLRAAVMDRNTAYDFAGRMHCAPAAVVYDLFHVIGRLRARGYRPGPSGRSEPTTRRPGGSQCGQVLVLIAATQQGMQRNAPYKYFASEQRRLARGLLSSRTA